MRIFRHIPIALGFGKAAHPHLDTARLDLPYAAQVLIDGDTICWLGVVLFAAGGALRIWPVCMPGNRFSGLVAIQPGHTLVTSGIYGVIRHPSCLGLLINSLGWSLAFRSAVGVFLTVLLIPPVLVRMEAEENLLHSQVWR